MALTKISTGMLKADAASVDLNIDAGTLFLDVANNRVGIANTSPTAPLMVQSQSNAIGITLLGRTSDSIGELNFASSNGTNQSSIQSRTTDLRVKTLQSIPLTFHTANAERMRILADGKIGVGITTPTSKVDIRGTHGATHSRGQLYLSNTESHAINQGSQISLGGTYAGTNDTYFASIAGRKENATSANYAGYLQFATRGNGTNNAERMRITSTGNVGIGITAPDNKLHVYKGNSGHTWSFDGGDGIILENSDSLSINIAVPAANSGNILFSDANARGQGRISYTHNNDAMSFMTGGISSERMRIDSSGRLLIGTTSTTPGFSTTNGHAFHVGDASHISRDQGVALVINRGTNDGGIVQFRKSGTYVGAIESRAGVVTTLLLNPASGNGAGISGGTKCIVPADEGGIIDNDISLGIGTHRFKDLHLSNDLKLSNGSYIEFGDSGTSIYGSNSLDVLLFTTAGSERGRFDSSGNFMVGKTATGLGNQGAEFSSTGQLKGTAANQVVAYLNRTSSDGSIIEFRKDNSTVGHLGTYGTDLYIGQNNSGLRFEYAGLDAIVPFDADSVAINDGVIDLGHSQARFKNLHLSGMATIHDITSDGVIRSTNNANVDGPNFNVSTTNKDTAEYAYRVDRSGTVVGGLRIDGNAVLNSRLTFGYNSHYFEAGTNSVAFKNSSGTAYIDITNTGTSIIGQVLVGTNDSRFAENNLRFKSAGAAYIDHNTTGQSLYVRVSNSSALDTTPITIASSGSVGFNCTPQRGFDSRNALNIFGTGGYTELMLRGRAGTAQNLGAFHFSIRSDVGGNNDDLMLLRFTGGNSPSYAGTSMHIRNDNGYVGIGDNIGQASSRLNIRGNSDVSDEDCMLTIDDVDGSSGSRIPSIMFRSVTGGVTTNQGRIRGTDTNGMVLSASSALGNDLVIQSAGRIGLGTPSNHTFDSNITAYHATNAIKSMFKLWTNTADNTGTEGGAIEWVASGDKTAVGSKIAATRVASGGKMDLRFYTGRNTDSNHEKMRIDSSGNVMVGTTNTVPGAGNTSTGVSVYNDGRIFASKAGNTTMSLNRNTSDGNILELRKDGSTVGSLASILGAYLAVRSNGGNLRLGADNTDYWSIDEYRLYPMNDAVDDIGLSSHRVRNIYLSGGVNFSDASGGIAYSAGNSANTLDDYEEGTWSPVLGGSGGSTGQSYNIQNGRYTKIGNFLHCTFDVQLSTLGTLSGTYVTLSNFPFSPYGSNQGGAISIGYSTGFTGSTAHPIRGYVSGSQCYLMEGGESSSGSNYIQVSENKMGGSARIIGSITLSLA